MAIDLDGRFKDGRMPTSSFGDFSRTGVDPTLMLSSDFPVVIGHDGAFHTAAESRREWIPRVRRLRADGTVVIVATVHRK